MEDPRGKCNWCGWVPCDECKKGIPYAPATRDWISRATLSNQNGKKDTQRTRSEVIDGEAVCAEWKRK